MFKRWKEAREKRLQCEAAIQQDDYLRRLRNSANMLSGLSHSGNGEELDYTLAIHEVRHVLRSELNAAIAQEKDVQDAPEIFAGTKDALLNLTVRKNKQEKAS